MTDDLRRQAHSVLLPAMETTDLDAGLLGFLRDGGRALLLGESRAEYVARRMSEQRVRTETADDLRTLTRTAATVAQAPVLVAMDVELGGIQRASHLVPALPIRLEAAGMDDGELASRLGGTARALRALGVNLALAPILDLMDGPNPWLDGRHLGPDPELVRRVAVLQVRVFEDAGVATTAKHFPGHRGLRTDPAVEARAVVPGDPSGAHRDLEVFREAIRAGASCVMTGPGTIAALDPERPALLSRDVVGLLRDDLRFDGLVISDDLDAAAVLHGRTLEQALVEALRAGNDLVMVAATNRLDALADVLVDAVREGTLGAGRLAEAAARVDALASLRGRASPRRRPVPPGRAGPRGGG